MYQLELDPGMSQARLSIDINGKKSVLSRWSLRKNSHTGKLEMASLSPSGQEGKKSVVHEAETLVDLGHKLAATLGKPVAVQQKVSSEGFEKSPYKIRFSA
jgi:hypothetical protein